MRVLHVVTSLDPGGMENGVCNLANGLSTFGFETHVACLEKRGVFANRLLRPENIYTLGKRDGFSLRAVWSLMRTLRCLQPHVVHTHNLGPLIYAAIATFGGRTYPIIHGEHSRLAPWELAPRRLLQRHKFYRACRAVHTVSQNQLDELIQLNFPCEKLSTIANGVDITRFAPTDRVTVRNMLGLPVDATVLGLVGRFGPFKRHDVLLAAFEEIAPRHPEVHLLFIGGGGSEEERIRKLAAASRHSDRIH
ncbi:MAG: glycosyltransferase, partial [Verrucomicrobiota bacterium]